MIQESCLDFSITDDEKEILELVEQVSKENIIPQRAELDKTETFPHDILDKFKQAGLFSILFAEEHGGLGSRNLIRAITTEIIGKYCIGVGTAVGASKLGAIPIEFGGTQEQKKKYLPPLASGEKLAAFALSEPDAGSDVPNLSTIADKKGDRYVLNGTKQWISNAGVADTYTVFALTNKKRGTRGISCFIVEKGTKGLSFGKLEDKMGIRCSHTRQVILEDVEVPEENLVGLKPGKGFIQALNTLNISRPFIASMGVGLAQGAYDEASRYTYQRVQFNKKIISIQAVNHILADMAIKIDSARFLTYRAALAIDQAHPKAPKFSAMAKYEASECAVQVVNDALQLHGGNGFY